MQFRRQSRDELPVNITPLIDVVFLLLIFFMVSTTFTKETRLNVNLPEANGEATEIDTDVIEVTIAAGGAISINGQSVVNTQFETVSKALEKIASGRFDLPLIITADAKAPHQSVVTAMDAAGQLGFSQLSITTQLPDEESEN